MLRIVDTTVPDSIVATPVNVPQCAEFVVQRPASVRQPTASPIVPLAQTAGITCPWPEKTWAEVKAERPRRPTSLIMFELKDILNIQLRKMLDDSLFQLAVEVTPIRTYWWFI